MTTQILINSKKYEVRLALVENGIPSELHIQRASKKGLTGNIYRGKVVRVLPGMQAAFVNIGLERTGFLYVDDVLIPGKELEGHRLVHENHPENRSSSPFFQESDSRRTNGLCIEHLLHEGQSILVQVSKDPIGTKGARLTCNISIPGRNLVLLPHTNHIGISKKIENEEKRISLKEQIDRLRPKETGFIVRTVAEQVTESEIQADMEFLLLLWKDIQKKAAVSSLPALVYEDLDVTLRSVRDLFTPAVDALIVDERATFEKVNDFVNRFIPLLHNRVQLYEHEKPLFETYNLDTYISRAMEKKVWLNSGGYLIFETTEALSVIDVNTGRFVGKTNLDETLFKTNMEAAKEIAYQLRLRNIGGIIIVDFIDMEVEAHREELFAYFKETLKKDKSRINILRISEFGLVQMTRKRSSENLTQMICEPCFYCAGEGVLKSQRTICYEIFRLIENNAKQHQGDSVTLQVHKRIANMLDCEEKVSLQQLEYTINKTIYVVPQKDIHIEKFNIIWN